MTDPRPVVFTALIGGYEELTEQPVALDSQAQFVCFTDDPALTSRTWTIRHIDPILPLDAVRSARDVKIRPHRYLAEAGQSLWIDNSVLLLRTPEVVLGDWLGDAELAMPMHSFRDSVLEEFAEVGRLGLDESSRVYEQAAHYRAVDPHALDERPLWTGMIARRMDSSSVRRFDGIWMDHVLRYSRRDQLSVNVALRQARVVASVLEMDSHISINHRWPSASGRLPDSARRQFTAAFVPEDVARSGTDARLQQLEARIDDLTRTVLDLEEERADLILDVAHREAELAGAGVSTIEDAELQRLQRAEQDLATVLASRSFRFTQPARRVASRLRGGPRP